MKRLAVCAVLSASLSVSGCDWFNSNGPTVVKDLSALASCVLVQVFGGVTSPGAMLTACGPATLSDVEQILASLLSYYGKQTTGTGAALVHCGSGKTPVKGAPECISDDQYQRIVTVHAAAAAGAQ